jgi:radical SAM superfamily enzyme YgiQ (UPF0313 family)
MISWKLIQKARERLGREEGAVLKAWAGRITICLVYPNRYGLAMSNLGFQVVYRALNEEADVVCERAFLPDPEEIEEHRATGSPLFSLESQKPLSDFDLIAFSLSFENDSPNILTLLDLARIPAEARLRGEHDPLVLAGGVAVFINPEPLADFFDFFLLGEAEEAIPELAASLRQAFSGPERLSKGDLFRRLAEIEGIYVPRLYRVTYGDDGKLLAMEPEPGVPDRVRRRWIREVDRHPTRSLLFSPEAEFRGMAVVEVNRGCPRRCRFCAASYVYHPWRNRGLDLLKDLASEGLGREKRIGLAGTAVSDHPDLQPLCDAILEAGGEISLGSLRLDTLTPELLRVLKQGAEQTVAIAPEAGSERLRRMIRKGYTDEAILRAVDLLVEAGLVRIKAYFMIGLPTETEEDVKAILTLAKRIKHRIVSGLKGKKAGWRVVLSVNPFVPKPATPFQWAPMEEVGRLKQKLKLLGQGLRAERGIEMIHDVPKWAYVQALLSRGDRRVGRILAEVHRLGGDWGKALRETAINPDFYVYRERSLDERFPWDFIDHGLSKEALKEDYLKAMKEAGE